MELKVLVCTRVLLLGIVGKLPKLLKLWKGMVGITIGATIVSPIQLLILLQPTKVPSLVLLPLLLANLLPTDLKVII
jgi:hypothetical protein